MGLPSLVAKLMGAKQSTRLKRAKSSEKSLSCSEGPSMGLWSFHEALVRERDVKHSFDEIYEVLDDIGHGGLCQIYKIRKRDSKIGGSSRPEGVRKKPSLLSLFPSPSSTSSLNTQQQQGVPMHFPLYYALKVINLKLVAGGMEKIDQLKNEVELLKTLDHRSIIKAYETFTKKETKQLMIVMELCTGGDLYARMPYTEVQVACVIKQVLSAVAYMHDRGIIHRDIKMENIMHESLHPNAAIKVIDFGLSAAFAQAGDVLQERVGTLYSMAPETMQGRYTAQADLWSIGVCTYIMLSGGEKPFEGKTPKQLVAKVLLGQYSFDPAVFDGISDQAKDFVRKLLCVEPNDRLTAAQAIRHPWITECCRNGVGVAFVDEDLKQRVREGIIKYAERSEFRKLALNVIAKKSSAQEIFELRQVFDEFDTENTGTITLEEFKNALAKFDYSEEDLYALFRKVDVNRNNVINYTEFLAAALETQGTIEEYRLAEAFDLMDSDDSGYISREDLRKILGAGSDEAYIDQLISEADFKNDGQISYEEFLQVFTERKKDRVSSIYEDVDHSPSSSPAGTDEVLSRFGLLTERFRRRINSVGSNMSSSS